MNALPTERVVSDEEFWELVEQSEQKLEHINGRVYVRGQWAPQPTLKSLRAMAGGTYTHSRIIENLAASLKTRLRSTGCSASGSNFHIGFEKSSEKLLPDNAVHCGSPQLGSNGQTLLNPVSIFEVLSPTTQDYDQNEKFDSYARISSLADYVLVWTTFIKVAHYARQDNGWLLRTYTAREDAFPLSGAPISPSLDELYDELDVPLQLILFPQPEAE